MKCKSCKGQGSIYRTSWDDEDELVSCSDCQGTGVVDGREEDSEDGALTKGLMKLVLLAGISLIVFIYLTK